MPLDIALFRDDARLAAVRESQRRRAQPDADVDAVVALDKAVRADKFQLDQLRKDLATVNKSLAAAHKAAAAAAAAAPAPGGAATAQTLSSSADASHSAAATTDIKAAIVAKEEALEARTAQLRLALNAIGNLVHDSVPVASDEAHNAVLRTWATDKRLINPALAVSSGGTSHATLASSSSPSSSSSSSQASAVGGGGGGAVAPFELLHHHQLLYMIDGYDAERGARVAGHRGYYLKNAGVLLNQALLNYGLAFLLGKQFTAIQPPFFLNEEVMAETAQLSDFDESLYKISGGAPGEQAKYLIATSEQPLSALHRGEWLQPKELPLKYAGISTCFRKEAGSYGRDAWGVFRVHQFEKVEQFVLASPAQSWQLMEEMMAASEQFYQSLALPYRVINIVSGALNSAAAKKYDLEAWFPTLGAYRELVSCSNCTDYQARALGTRFGFKKAGDREKAYVHMLNGTLCATERTMCCVLENYQEANGVRVPPPLVPYMGGTTFLPFVKELPEGRKFVHSPEAAPPKSATPSSFASGVQTRAFSTQAFAKSTLLRTRFSASTSAGSAMQRVCRTLLSAMR